MMIPERLKLRPLRAAGCLLTRLPFPDPGELKPAELGQSVLWYPVIGLALGILLGAASSLLGRNDPGVAASLVLILWVWATGALHLDGLADSADAWVGGLSSRARTLEIMKDPNCGPMGVSVIVLALLAKWSALCVALEQNAWPILIAIPLFARALLPLLIATTPYARQHGMVSQQVANLPQRAAWLSASLSLSVGALLIGWSGWLLLAASVLILILARRAMLKRLQGFTGDTAGALVELAETLLLLAATLSLN